MPPSSSFVRIGRYVLDVSLSESHTFESEVTEFPVESGATISDNIRPKPMKISIEGVVTDTPLDSNAFNKPVLISDVFGANLAPIFGEDQRLITGAGLTDSIKFLRSAEAYAYLKSIWSSREVVQVRTSMGTYDNMALTSLDVPRSKETTGALKFTASFQQIQRVTNQRMRTRVAIRNGKGKKDLGPTPTTGNGWYVKEVHWRQANPAGSERIYNTVLVRQYKSTTKLMDPPVWIYASGPRAQTALSNQMTGFETAKLTPSELSKFELDWARDRLSRAWLGDAAVNAGATMGPNGGTYHPKTYQSDLGEHNRKALSQQSGAPNFGGDPDFNNKANFFSDNPTPSLAENDKGTFSPGSSTYAPKK